MTREDLFAETEEAAVELAGTPLSIMGYDVDRTDPEEVYRALLWIEDGYIGLLKQQAADAARDWRYAALLFGTIAAIVLAGSVTLLAP